MQDLTPVFKLATALVVATALVGSPVAEGALVLRIAISPARPHARHAVQVQIRTYAPMADPSRRCGYRPVAWRISYPFRVQAVGPDHAIHDIRVRQARGNLYLGRFTPRLAGSWVVRVANFAPDYPRCSGSLIRFKVTR